MSIQRRMCWSAGLIVGEMRRSMIGAPGLIVQTLWLPQTSHHLRCMSMPFCSISTMFKTMYSLRDDGGNWLNYLLISLCLLPLQIKEILKNSFHLRVYIYTRQVYFKKSVKKQFYIHNFKSQSQGCFLLNVLEMNCYERTPKMYI